MDACYLNLGGPMYYVGLDLHKRYVTACVLDRDGTVVARERRLGTSADVLLAWLAPLGAEVAIALEATLSWAWLHDRLTAAGYAVTVAHAQQVKLICAARCKTDPVDAQKLAELLRMELLPAIWIPDPATRAQRKLLRGRAWLVRRRTQVKNRVHAYHDPDFEAKQAAGNGLSTWGMSAVEAISSYQRRTSCLFASVLMMSSLRRVCR